MPENAKWYVVHTYSGYENKVADNLRKIVENRGLEDFILDIKVPTELVTEITDEKTREVERKIFPSYVFIHMVMTEDIWYVIRNTRGVTGFVGPGSKPVPLSESEIAALGVETKEIKVNVAVGDNVNVLSGPFEGFVGVVASVDAEAGRCTVTVSMFGRDTPVDIEISQVSVVE